MNANKRAELATKLVLALLFVLGLGLVFNGLQAQKIYNQSGFSAEGAFQAIYRLSEETESDWNTLLSAAPSTFRIFSYVSFSPIRKDAH